jgi:hypothetical protein
VNPPQASSPHPDNGHGARHLIALSVEHAFDARSTDQPADGDKSCHIVIAHFGLAEARQQPVLSGLMHQNGDSIRAERISRSTQRQRGGNRLCIVT